MKTKLLLSGLSFLALAFSLIACGDDTTSTTEKSCSELGDSVKTSAGSSLAAYKVIRPNGGEVYRVGDTIQIRASGNINSSNASLFLQVGSKYVRPASLNGNLNLYSNCDMIFVIPDSLQTAIGTPVTISMVSDSVKVLVESYTDNTRRDNSDTYFQIKAHSAP